MKIKNKMSQYSWFIFSIILFFIGISHSSEVFAKELNQTGFVDSFELTPREYRVYEIGALNIKISEKNDNKLKQGDTLTLSAPENMNFTLFTETSPLILSEGGITYGIGVTSKDTKKLVITFNDKVDNYSGFKGELNLAVQAGWIPAGEPNVEVTEKYSTNLGTNLPMKDYKIVTIKIIGKNPYFSKPGGSVWANYPNWVYWSLNINRDQASVTSDIKFIDTLHPGHVFSKVDKSKPLSIDNIDNNHFYFNIFTNGQEAVASERRVSAKEFIDKGYGTVEFINEIEFVVTINASALRNHFFNLDYQTEITPEGKYQTYFYNDAVATYNDLTTGELTEKKDLNKQAKNLVNNAVITPDKGILRIMKLAKNDNDTKPLANVTFKIFNENGTSVDFIDNNLLKTNSSGRVDTPFLNPGKYYVTEINAPDFVTFDKDKKYPFTIVENSVEGVVLVISNDLKKINIPVQKIWKDNKVSHPTIKFNLFANDKVVDSVQLESGKLQHIFQNMPVADLDGNEIKYSIKEENVDGFISEVLGNKEQGFTVINTPIAEFTADKKADKKLLKPGETFTYTISVKNTVSGSTLKNVLVEDVMPEGIDFIGDLKLNGVATGEVNGNSIKVTIPELKGEDTAKITFTVKVKDDAIEGEVTNIATVTDPNDPDKPKKPEEKVEIFREVDLRLIKTDMEGKTVLKDALFDLYQITEGKEHLVTSISSDVNGRINFEKLKTGSYVIKEKTAPTGYQLLDKSIQLTIDKLGELKLNGELSEMVSLIKKDKTFELTVKNKAEDIPGGQLPQTGGNGHTSYLIVASSFMLFALSLAGYYVYRSRKGWKS